MDQSTPRRSPTCRLSLCLATEPAFPLRFIDSCSPVRTHAGSVIYLHALAVDVAFDLAAFRCFPAAFKASPPVPRFYLLSL